MNIYKIYQISTRGKPGIYRHPERVAISAKYLPDNLVTFVAEDEDGAEVRVQVFYEDWRTGEPLSFAEIDLSSAVLWMKRELKLNNVALLSW